MTNREIRRRIVSVQETVKITKAMYSISMAKMIAAKAALPAATEYRDVCARIIRAVSASFPNDIFFSKRGDRTGFLVIAADKGLCGDHNAQIIECAKTAVDGLEERYIFTVGNVAHESFTKAGYEVDMEYLRASTSYSAAAAIADDMMYLYENDMLDEIKVVYTDAGKNVVTVDTLLPIEAGQEKVETEPFTASTLHHCVRDHLIATLRYMLMSSSLAEHTARARIMSQSTDNAEEMIGELTAKYNRARQESITRALQDGRVTDSVL